MNDCTHTLAENETLCADGACVICMSKELERLTEQLQDCETSLRIWDETETSEYFMRHPQAAIKD